MHTYKTALLTIPKAGSQWVSGVLSDPRVAGFNGFYRVEPAENLNEWRAQWKNAAGGSFFAPVYNVSASLWQQVAGENDRAVVILRDPRDMLVSWMYAQCFSHGANTATRIWRPMMLSLPDRARLALAISRFHMWAATFDSWAPGKSGGITGVHVAKYERLLSGQTATFAELARFLGWDAEQMENVVADFSFQRLSGRHPGKENTASHYRKGVAGDWRNHFDGITGRFFEMLYPGLLIRLGYETTSDWFDVLPEIRETGESSENSISIGAAVELQAEINLLNVKMEEERRIAAENMDVLSRAADERGRLCERLATEFVEKDDEIKLLARAAQELREICGSQAREIENLSHTCQERLELIERLDADLSEHIRQMEARNT